MALGGSLWEGKTGAAVVVVASDRASVRGAVKRPARVTREVSEEVRVGQLIVCVYSSFLHFVLLGCFGFGFGSKICDRPSFRILIHVVALSEGAANGKVDVLSRPPCEIGEDCNDPQAA